MKNHNVITCTNCVMDTTDPAITFDENGVCDHCRTYFSHTLKNWHTGAEGRSRLDVLVARIKADRRGAEYDCIIGISGGFDSSYLTHIAVAELGLKPLIFHVDAGWNSDIAVSNIEKLVEGLNLDLFTEVINWKEMRELQLAFFKAGVPHIDTPQDHAFFATMYKFASKHGVKHILTGANLSTECVRNPLDWMYYQSDSWQVKDIFRQFGTGKLQDFPLTSIIWHKVWLPIFRGIKVSRPLNYVDYIKQDAKNLLVSEYGWKPYPQKHFESRFTKFYESFWLPERFGIDVRKVQFASLILTGQMTRDEALNELAKSPYDPLEVKNEKLFVANKLEIPVEELESYLTAPRKTYRDYRNQKMLYDLGSKILKRLGKEVGGKR